MSNADPRRLPKLDGLALTGAEADAQGAAGSAPGAPALFSNENSPFSFDVARWIVDEFDPEGYLFYRFLDKAGRPAATRQLCHMENALHWQPLNDAARVLRAIIVLWKA